MSQKILEVTGADAHVLLMDDRVVIQRRGMVSMLKYGLNSRREIPLASITSVNFRDANFFKLGEIDFDFAGRSQIDRRQNCVVFSRKQQAAFYKLKERVFELMQKSRR